LHNADLLFESFLAVHWLSLYFFLLCGAEVLSRWVCGRLRASAVA